VDLTAVAVDDLVVLRVVVREVVEDAAIFDEFLDAGNEVYVLLRPSEEDVGKVNMEPVLDDEIGAARDLVGILGEDDTVEFVVVNFVADLEDDFLVNFDDALDDLHRVQLCVVDLVVLNLHLDVDVADDGDVVVGFLGNLVEDAVLDVARIHFPEFMHDSV